MIIYNSYYVHTPLKEKHPNDFLIYGSGNVIYLGAYWLIYALRTDLNKMSSFHSISVNVSQNTIQLIQLSNHSFYASFESVECVRNKLPKFNFVLITIVNSKHKFMIDIANLKMVGKICRAFDIFYKIKHSMWHSLN